MEGGEREREGGRKGERRGSGNCSTCGSEALQSCDVGVQ